MAKLKITSEQYDRLLLREQETRLKETAVALNESSKEVLLGVALLLGMRLTGLNKSIADEAIKKDSVIAQIKNTLEDSDKTGELSKAMEEKGMPNPDRFLAKNAMKLINKLNGMSGPKLDGRAIKNLVGLDSEISKDYNLD